MYYNNIMYYNTYSNGENTLYLQKQGPIAHIYTMYILKYN